MKKHLLQAAERGDAEAQFNLAIMCENGLDDDRYTVEGNRPEAMRWLLAAANQGLPRAQVRLAEIYAAEPDTPDPDTPDNAVRACGWYLVATAGMTGAHLQKAQTAYQRIADRLTSVQIAQVTNFAQDWTPQVAAAIEAPPADLPK